MRLVGGFIGGTERRNRKGELLILSSAQIADLDVDFLACGIGNIHRYLPS